jgi:hypothetical protein
MIAGKMDGLWMKKKYIFQVNCVGKRDVREMDLNTTNK